MVRLQDQEPSVPRGVAQGSVLSPLLFFWGGGLYNMLHHVVLEAGEQWQQQIHVDS